MNRNPALRSRTAPEVSVLIPFHEGRGRYLWEALDSVAAQDFRDYEVILVDDGSRDGIAAPARRWAQARDWTYLRLPQASGPAVARARGAALARGRWLAFLDSDDRWRPDKLRIQLGWKRRPGVVMTYSDFGRIDGNGRPIRGRRIVSPFHTFYPRVCQTSMMMLKRSAFEKVGGMFQGYRYLRDEIDLWDRLLRRFGKNSCQFVPVRLGDYRIHRSGVSWIRPRRRWDAVSREKFLDMALRNIRAARAAR